MPVKPEYRQAFPAPDEIERSLLTFLRERGGAQASMASKQVYKPFAEYLKVPPQAFRLERKEYYTSDPSDARAWNNLVQWAVCQLRKRGQLESTAMGRGKWTICTR